MRVIHLNKFHHRGCEITILLNEDVNNHGTVRGVSQINVPATVYR